MLSVCWLLYDGCCVLFVVCRSLFVGVVCRVLLGIHYASFVVCWSVGWSYFVLRSWFLVLGPE